MSGPRRAVPMCARCSDPAVVKLEVDAVEDPLAEYPCHHVTVLAVCNGHIDVGVRAMLDALNSRPNRPPERWRLDA